MEKMKGLKMNVQNLKNKNVMYILLFLTLIALVIYCLSGPKAPVEKSPEQIFSELSSTTDSEKEIVKILSMPFKDILKEKNNVSIERILIIHRDMQDAYIKHTVDEYLKNAKNDFSFYKKISKSFSTNKNKEKSISNLINSPIVEALSKFKTENDNITLNEILVYISTQKRSIDIQQEFRNGDKYKLIKRLQTMTFDEILHQKDPTLLTLSLRELVEFF